MHLNIIILFEGLMIFHLTLLSLGYAWFLKNTKESKKKMNTLQ